MSSAKNSDKPDLKAIKNPIVRQALQKREGDFMFNYNDWKDHTDMNSSVNSRPYHSDHTDKYDDYYDSSYDDHYDYND